MKLFCADCNNEIDTKKHNVGRDNRVVICDSCTQLRCEGKKDKTVERLPKRNFKQGKRARGK